MNGTLHNIVQGIILLSTVVWIFLKSLVIYHFHKCLLSSANPNSRHKKRLDITMKDLCCLHLQCNLLVCVILWEIQWESAHALHQNTATPYHCLFEEEGNRFVIASLIKFRHGYLIYCYVVTCIASRHLDFFV